MPCSCYLAIFSFVTHKIWPPFIYCAIFTLTKPLMFSISGEFNGNSSNHNLVEPRVYLSSWSELEFNSGCVEFRFELVQIELEIFIQNELGFRSELLPIELEFRSEFKFRLNSNRVQDSRWCELDIQNQVNHWNEKSETEPFVARGPACCEFYFYEIQDLLLSLFLHNLSILFLLVLPNVSSAIGFRWPEWKAIIGMFCQTFLADLDLSSLTDIRIVYGIP